MSACERIGIMPTPSEDGLVAKALTATRETTKIELLREFSPAAPGGWCELLKDIVAFANSGGGVIAIGLQKNGSPTGWDASEFLATDAAQLTSMLATYLGGQTPDVEIVGAQKDGQPVALLIVGARTGAPIVFEHAGIYTDADGHETTAFLPGTVYFRHGTHSAPGSTKDISRFIDREISTQRREWLKNVRTVAAAPRDARVLVLRPSKKDPSASVPQLRVVDDPDAPAVARTDFDITHPYRQTELVAAVNERLGQKVVTGYDLQCVRKVHATDQRAEFFHRPKFGSPQYSEAFVRWLVAHYEADSQFFEHAKAIARPHRTTDTA